MYEAESLEDMQAKLDEFKPEVVIVHIRHISKIVAIDMRSQGTPYAILLDAIKSPVAELAELVEFHRLRRHEIGTRPEAVCMLDIGEQLLTERSRQSWLAVESYYERAHGLSESTRLKEIWAELLVYETAFIQGLIRGEGCATLWPDPQFCIHSYFANLSIN